MLVHVEMQGYYVEIFSAEFENLLTELDVYKRQLQHRKVNATFFKHFSNV